MAKKKVAGNNTVVVSKFMGDASVFMLTLPRVYKEAFRAAFECTFNNADVEKDSNKIKHGIYCDTDSGKMPYADAILLVPPVFPSRMQKFLAGFCQKYNLKLNPYIPDPEQEHTG